MAQFSLDNRSHPAHAYIVSSPSEAERLGAARRLAAAAVCTGGSEKPCGLCRHCRKAAAGIHPDIAGIRRLVDEKSGKPKQVLSVEQVRAMAADAYILPNEAECKVYIIEEAEYMNAAAQNAALKLLEEPPAWVRFILCVPGAAMLLPTVRSRCAEINCNGGEQESDETAEKLAAGFIEAASRSRAALLGWCLKNEGIDTRLAREFIDCSYRRLADMLCGRADSLGMDSRRLTALLELTERCGEYLRLNTGVKHIFGLLAVKTPEAGRNRG